MTVTVLTATLGRRPEMLAEALARQVAIALDMPATFEGGAQAVVQALSEMGVPVQAREGPGGGYSLPGSYRVEPLPLTGRPQGTIRG